MLFGEVVSDRMPRPYLLLMTQTTLMILAFALAALIFLGHIQPWHIVLLSFAPDIRSAFDTPVRQAFVVELVERKDLVNAIAINSIMFNLAIAIGFAVAGVVYAFLGPAWCFTINGVSFIAVISALLMMRIKAEAPREHMGTAWGNIREGLVYVVSHSIIRVVVVLVRMLMDNDVLHTSRRQIAVG